MAHFVRSAARGLANRPGGGGGIRLMALCPEFVETPLVTQMVKQVGRVEARVVIESACLCARTVHVCVCVCTCVSCVHAWHVGCGIRLVSCCCVRSAGGCVSVGM